LILNRLDPNGPSIDFDQRRSPSKLLIRAGDLRHDVKRTEPRPDQMVKRSQVIRTWPPLFTSSSVSVRWLERQPPPLAVVTSFPSTEGFLWVYISVYLLKSGREATEVLLIARRSHV